MFTMSLVSTYALGIDCCVIIATDYTICLFVISHCAMCRNWAYSIIISFQLPYKYAVYYHQKHILP